MQPPYTPERAIDLYFLEHRAKLLDLASFIDRVERADPKADLRADPRMASFLDAIEILTGADSARAERIQLLFSDRSDELLDVAPGKGAIGADPNYNDTPSKRAEG